MERLPDGTTIGFADEPGFSSTGLRGMIPEFEGLTVTDPRDIEARLPSLRTYLGLVGDESYRYRGIEDRGTQVAYVFDQYIGDVPVPQIEAVFLVDEDTALVTRLEVGAFLDAGAQRSPEISPEQAFQAAARSPDAVPVGFARDGHEATLEYQLVHADPESRLILGWRVHLWLKEPEHRNHRFGFEWAGQARNGEAKTT